MRRVVVTGAGGFIGSHLVTNLKRQGYWVRGVDVKPPAFAPTDADQFELLDLRSLDQCLLAMRDVHEVYALAADMGGIGYISTNHATIFRNNSLISVHSLEAARLQGVERLLYSSSACIYPRYLQNRPDVDGLREESAYPADPQEAYGWEKLVGEQACQYYRQEFGLETRVVRLHNVYGPNGCYDGGREKAPAAICRKVAQAEVGSAVEVWGGGDQTRSFCFIDDCVDGIHRIMRSSHSDPINLGSEERVSIDQLVQMVIDLSGKQDIAIEHVDGPQGVRGRNSDNSRLRALLNWQPETALTDGMRVTYRWVADQIGRATQPAARASKVA